MSGPNGPARRELPLFPLRMVLFPGGLLELKIFEARYLDLMSRCMRGGTGFGVVALKSGAEAKVSDEPVSFFDIGTRAELIGVEPVQTGILHVRCRGASRFALGASRQEPGGLWIGDAIDIADDSAAPPAERHAKLVRSLADAIVALAEQGAKPFLEPHRLGEAGWVANRWCELLPLPVEAKQRVLAIADPLARLDAIDALMRSKQAPPSSTGRS